MADGKTKASIDGKFADRISELEDLAKSLAKQFRNLDDYRKWAVPKDLKTRDLLDVPGLHDPAWDRNNLNRMYSEQVMAGPGSKGGTAGDLIAVKWQVDFMASEERAFRMRHASYARCAALMHGRLDGHGKNPDSIFSYLKASVQEVIQAGTANGKNDGRG